MEEPKENKAKSQAQPNLRREEPQPLSETTMSQAVQINEVQLVRETLEQSLQELQETSQKATSSKLDTVASSNEEWNNIRCPICLDAMKNTMITMTCFHRFCKNCIVTALRRDNKECPMCRSKLISKRSLNPDPQFDALIMKMHSSFTENDVPQEKALSRKKYKTQQEHSVSIDKGKKIEVTNCVQESKEKQIETSTGCEGNHDTSPCNNTSTHNSDEAGLSEKWANTFGLEHDNKDAVTAWASELDSSLHPTFGEKDDPVRTGLTKTSGELEKQRI